MIKLKKLVKEETSLIKEGTRWNVGIEAQSKNRGRAEKSRLKKEGKEFTDSQLASRIAYHANLHKGTGVGYANAFGQLAVFLRDIGYKKSFIEAVKVMKVLAKKKRVESVVEDHIKFTKEEMVQLHKDGKIEKGGHTIEFGESVNEATVSGTDKAVKFWQDMFRPGPIPKEYINQLIKKKGVLPSKSHIKAIYRANKNPSSKDLEKAWKGLVKDKYVRAASGLWRWNKQFESVNEKMGPKQFHSYMQYVFDTQFKTPDEKKMKKSLIKKLNIAQKKKGLPIFKESVNEAKLNEYDKWKNTRIQAKNIFRMLKQKHKNNIPKMKRGLEVIFKQNKTKPDQQKVMWQEFNKFFKIKESVNEAKIAHSKGGYIEVGKWYLFNYGKWKTQVKVVSIDSKGMKIYNPNDQWKYIIPMKMVVIYIILFH